MELFGEEEAVVLLPAGPVLELAQRVLGRIVFGQRGGEVLEVSVSGEEGVGGESLGGPGELLE